jgi:Tol biopolymer transport system component
VRTKSPKLTVPFQPRQDSSKTARAQQTPSASQAIHAGDDYRVRTLPPEPPGKIAFSSDRAGNSDIYVMDPDGGSIIRLTDDPAEDTNPTWSPDGNRIAFVSTRDGNKEIYTVSATGGGATRLTTNTFEDFNPTWSPLLTNQRIAFVSSRDGNDEIYVMAADGTGQTNVTQNMADDNDPSWAPSATQLGFASNRDGDKFNIYRIGVDGNNLVQLTFDPTSPASAYNDLATTWPAGRITFQSDRDGNDEIYTINAGDGANPVRITNNTAFDIDPTRSPDGARVVWVSNRDAADNLEIYAANADGSNVVRLTNNPSSDMEPAIQPLAAAASLGTVQLGAATYTIAENQPTLDITVTRTGGTGAASVEFATVPGSASGQRDYTIIERTIRFAAGETSKTIQLSIIDDLRNEGNETLTVSLGGAVNTTIGSPSSAVVTITDNDTTTSTTNPIDGINFFVRQHYLDFLSREPDQSGFNAWVGVLTNCPNIFNLDPNSPSAACDRIRVSSSFFLSTEFQIRGASIIRSYLAAYGRLPTFQEFIRDLAAVGGATADEATANRARYPDDFIQRPEFGVIYDSLSNTAFVDALIANTGVTFSNRATLISDLNSGAKTRSQVFNEIVDSTQFASVAFNRTFVLTQYFGYLRRDPDAAGFQAWLTYLNANPNDLRTMVHGFLNSIEYRARFGQL